MSLVARVAGTSLLIVILIMAACVYGYIACIVKVCTCDWQAPYKAEVVYTIGVVTGTGIIIGYLNIADGVVEIEEEEIAVVAEDIED